MKEGLTLNIYAPLLALGISLIMIGAILLILSLKPVQSKQGVSSGGFFVGVIGFLPIIFVGRKMLRLWLVAIIVSSILLGLVLLNPGLIGW